MQENNDRLTLVVGSLNCTRHGKRKLQRSFNNHRVAFLCPSEIDFVTGNYYNQIINALVELKDTYHINDFILRYSCQCYLLSTDFDMLCTELKNVHGIHVTLNDRCHLCERGDDDE